MTKSELQDMINEMVEESIYEYVEIEQYQVTEDALSEQYLELSLNEAFDLLDETTAWKKYAGDDIDKFNNIAGLIAYNHNKNTNLDDLKKLSGVSKFSKDKLDRVMRKAQPTEYRSPQDAIKSEYDISKKKFDEYANKENEYRHVLGLPKTDLSAADKYKLSDNMFKSTEDAVNKVKSPQKKEEMVNSVADTIKSSNSTPNKQEVKKIAARTVAKNVPGYRASSDGKITPNKSTLQATNNDSISKKKVLLIAGILTAIAGSVAAAAIIKHKKKKAQEDKNNKDKK